MLLQRQGKGQRRCVKGLGLEGRQSMEEGDRLIMDVLVLVHVHHIIHQVLEADTAQGPIHLLQDAVVTLFPQVEGAETTQDHHVIFH